MVRSSLPSIALACIALGGCATPAFRDSPPTTEVAAAPERYHDTAVAWGGKIIAVDNPAATTDVQVVA